MTSSTRTPYLLALILVGLPLVFSPFEFWDGRILFHALETGENRGAYIWFSTAGWFIQYYIFTAIQSIDGVDGPIGIFLIRLIIIGSLCGLIYESIRFYSNIIRLPQCWAIAASVAVALFPAWNVLLASSVIFIYIMCTWLSLLALRLIHDSSTVCFLAGVAILLLSFQLNSNFVFSIALAIAYLGSLLVYDGTITRQSTVKFFTVIAISFLAFIALKLSFTASGLYEGYNEMHSVDSLGDILHFAIEMIRYFQYPILLAAILMAAHLGLLLLGPGSKSFPTEEWRTLLWPVVLSLFLIGSAALPYVIVGKPADLRAILIEWNPRHTFLMAMPVGLFLASFARLLYHWHGLQNRKLAMLPTLAAIAILALILQAAFWQKLSRSAYEQGIITALAKETPPKPGIVKIVAPEIPAALWRFYESNWLMYRAYGKEEWFTSLTLKENQGMEQPEFVGDKNLNASLMELYKIEYIMSDFQSGCETLIKIEGNRFSIHEVLGWVVFSSELPDQISVSRITENCEAT